MEFTLPPKLKMNNQLEYRNKLKAKKPNFIRQQGISLNNLSENWRVPKGMHSKLRKRLRGKIKRPSIGYSSPKSVRNLHPSGLKPVLVFNEKQLKNLTENDGILLPRTLGKNNRLKLLNKIKESKLLVLNLKDIDNYIGMVGEEMEQRKKKRSDIKMKKEESKKKVIEKKKKEEKTETPEEKEKEEKETKRKVLESKK